MYQSVTDPFEKVTARHGFSEEWSRQQIAAKRREAAERSRQYEIRRARQLIAAPTWVVDLILATSEEHRVSPADVMSRSRRVKVVMARHDAIYRAKTFRPTVSLKRLGTWFRRDHTSIGHALASYQRNHPGSQVFTKHCLEKRHASTAKFQASRRQAGG